MLFIEKILQYRQNRLYFTTVLVSLTYIKLRSPLKFFGFSNIAFQVLQQLKTSQCKVYKTKGGLQTHYTLSGWENEVQMNTFTRNAAHLKAMKQSAELAKEIRTLTYEADDFPDWKTAKKLLFEKGKVLSF